MAFNSHKSNRIAITINPESVSSITKIFHQSYPFEGALERELKLPRNRTLHCEWRTIKDTISAENTFKVVYIEKVFDVNRSPKLVLFVENSRIGG